MNWDAWLLVGFSYCFFIGGFAFSVIGSVYIVYRELLVDVFSIIKSKIQQKEY